MMFITRVTFFTGMFFFNTYQSMNLLTYPEYKKEFDQYVQEYMQKNVNRIQKEEELFAKYYKSKSIDDEIRAISIAKAIANTNAHNNAIKPRLTDRFNMQINELIEKMIFYRQMESESRRGLAGSIGPKKDLNFLRKKLEEYIKMSPKEYIVAREKYLERVENVNPKGVTVVLGTVLYHDETIYDEEQAQNDAKWIMYIALNKFFGQVSNSSLELEVHYFVFYSRMNMNVGEIEKEIKAIKKGKILHVENTKWERSAAEAALWKLLNIVRGKRISPIDTSKLKDGGLLVTTFPKDDQPKVSIPLISETTYINLPNDKNIKKCLGTFNRLLFQLEGAPDVYAFDTDDLQNLQKDPIKMLEKNVSAHIVSDISVDYSSIMYAYSKNAQSGYYIEKEGHWKKGFLAHKMPINSLFHDYIFIVSHSQANNIRFFSFKKARDLSIGEKIAEYKANRLLSYKRNCFIAEEGISFFGIPIFKGLYIKYVDDNAKIIAEKKIATYSKGKCFSFLADINQRGDAFVYDACKKLLRTYTRDKNNKIKRMKYHLPEELKNHADPKQIHYLLKNNDLSSNDKSVIIILVYDDQIYQINIKNSNISDTKKLFPIEEKNRLAIATTAAALKKSSNVLWVILEDKTNHNKRYSAKKIVLNKE